MKSRRVFEGRIISLRVDEFDVNGQPRSRDVIEHPGSIAIVPVLEDGRIVFVRQHRYAIGKRLLELPAGTLEPGEPPEECAFRELQEEAGYKPGVLERLGGIYLAPGWCDEYEHVFLATDLSESRLDGDEDEELEVVPLSLDEALKMAAEGELVDSKSLAGLLLYRVRSGR